MKAQTVTPATEPSSSSSTPSLVTHETKLLHQAGMEAKQHETPSIEISSDDTTWRLYELLKSTKVEEVTQAHASHVVVLDSNESIVSALKKLSEVAIVTEHVIQPVHSLSSSQQAEQRQPQQKQPQQKGVKLHRHRDGIGLVDSLDIMAYMVELFTNPEKVARNYAHHQQQQQQHHHEDMPPPASSAPSSSTTTSTTTTTTTTATTTESSSSSSSLPPHPHYPYVHLQHHHHQNTHRLLQVSGSYHQHHLSTVTIGQIVTTTDTSPSSADLLRPHSYNPTVPIPVGTSLYDAIRLMIRVKAHRCPIVDTATTTTTTSDNNSDNNHMKNIVGVLTQASIVQFLCRHMDTMLGLSREHVGHLHLGTRPVITVPKHMRAIDAFKVMHEHGISGLGVIDPSGILIGNLSARDLKHLDMNNIHGCMNASASSFIQRVRANLINIVHPAISCTDDTELGFVIGRLTTNRIHRLYICDRELKPVGVISLRDVLTCVMNRIDRDLVMRERLSEEETKIHHQQQQQESSS